MHPAAMPSEPEATYAENVKRAHELRKKAQQLAKDELAVLNQAVDLNLLARQLAEATMRPAFAPAPTSLPFYISLPAGMGNPAFRMQLMRAQQAALGNQAQYVNLSSNAENYRSAAAASPAAANSTPSLPPLFTANGAAAAASVPAGSSELLPAVSAVGAEMQQPAAQRSVVQATADAVLQSKLDPEQLLQQHRQKGMAASADAAEQLESTEQIEAVSDVQQTPADMPAGAQSSPDVVQAAVMDVDS